MCNPSFSLGAVHPCAYPPRCLAPPLLLPLITFVLRAINLCSTYPPAPPEPTSNVSFPSMTSHTCGSDKLACARGADSSFMCRSPSRAQLPTDGAPVGAASCLLLHPLPSTPNLFSLVMRPVLPFLSCECFGCFKDSGQLLLPRKVCTYCTRCCSSIASCTVLADTPLQLSQQYCSVCSCDYDCYC